jgi:outer membrane protein OmpA-like peptidoglycan-associated protein
VPCDLKKYNFQFMLRTLYLLVFITLFSCKNNPTKFQTKSKTDEKETLTRKEEDFFVIDTKPVFPSTMEEKKEQKKKPELIATQTANTSTTPKKPPRKRIAVYVESLDDEINRMMDEQTNDFKFILPTAEIERLSEKKIRVSFDPNVYFLQNSRELTQDAQNKIAVISNVLNRYPSCEILIEGHEDSTEHALKHYELSEKRALNFLEFIVKTGVERERITFSGYGNLKPITNEKNENGRRLNRRIHLIITVDEEEYKKTKK